MSRPSRDSTHYDEAEQGKEVQRILTIIETQSLHMNNALNNKDLRKAIEHCDQIGKELRTISLSPKNYYHLYLATQNAFMPLFLYLRDEYEGSLLALYEQVQYLYYAVPRLYLMCCVGSAAVVKQATGVQFLMKDLVEMCRAVQHPTKGLFVRSFLMDMFKDKLPDINTTGEQNGTLMDSIEFLLINFIEMNKLTVRLQAGIKDKEKKVDEEKQLLQLVSKNLQFISNLEGMTFELYRNTIMPRIMDQILSCGDLHAQEFLMDVIISAFQPNYHLGTLEELLRCFPSLHQNVDIRPLLLNLMKVLADFIKNDEYEMDNFMKKIDIFKIFNEMLMNICQKRHTNAADFLALMVQFQDLQMIWYKNDEKKCFRQTSQILENVSNYLIEDRLDQYAVGHLMKLLQMSYSSFGVNSMLEISGFRNAITLLPYSKRKTVATDLINKSVKNNELIHSVALAKFYLLVIKDLITKVDDQPEQLDEFEMSIDVENASKLLHLVKDNSLFEEIITLFKNKMTEDSSRIQYSVPSLIMFALTRKCNEELVKFVFNFVISLLKMLIQLHHYVLAFKLSLYCGVAGTEAKIEKFMYFFRSAFEIYENIYSSDIQKKCIIIAIGTLQTLNVNEESFNEIKQMIFKSIQFVFRTSLRCELLCNFAALYMNNTAHCCDKKKAVEIVNDSFKEINCIIDDEEQVKVYVSVLNQFIRYYEMLDDLSADSLNEIVSCIKKNNEQLNDEEKHIVDAAFTYMKNKSSSIMKFSQIQLD